jgi:MFS family permease
MSTLDNTVVNVALPSIQADLHLGLSGLAWVVNAYVLSFAVLLSPVDGSPTPSAAAVRSSPAWLDSLLRRCSPGSRPAPAC